MNRMNEYQAILRELDEPVPGLEHTLDRAHARASRRRRFTRPLAAAAASFAIFVLLVNFCTPVAYACSKVPILRELAEAVTFSRSLTDAVDNEYVQPIALTQTDGEVTASVEYLIVDQKQVNVFFRLDSDVYTAMDVYPAVLQEDGTYAPCSHGLNDWNVPNGELQSITIDFVDEDVPSGLRLQLDISDFGSRVAEEIVSESEEDSLDEPDAMNYVASFDFLLEFDPEFTAAGKVYPINQTVVLEGQEITITDMEVYPTHLRVNIEDSPDNTAWLKSLYFYIETDWGMKFDIISNGIVATGLTDSKSMASFRADSSYFYDANHLKIVITGAEWLNKDMETIYVNLVTGETGPMPEGVQFHGATRNGDTWEVAFQAEYRKENHTHQLFDQDFYDAEGNEYHYNSWSSGWWHELDEDEKSTSFAVRFNLEDYPFDEVWLCPHYSHRWFADDPIVITVQ